MIACSLVALIAGCGGATRPARAYATTAALAPRHRPCPADDMTRVIALVNDIRRRHRLRLLGTDRYLARFAATRSAAMAADRRLSHHGWERALRRAGLVDDALGENVAYNYDQPESVVRGWMESPGHRANILRPHFKRIGVGCVIDDRGRRWWTQDFAG